MNICCVKWGDLYGPEYVNILFDMVLRNLSDKVKVKFYCFTDNPSGLHESIITKPIPENLKGWWPKLYLFKKDVFPDGERVFFIDLDTIIVSGLDDILKYDGNFAILEDFYRPGGYGSAFMSWKVGEYSYIWDKYVEAGFPVIDGGDQAWIEKCVDKADYWQDIYPKCFVSYKKDCEFGIPKNAKVICFHGVPMPHQITGGWVPNIWKVGGGSSLELAIEGNTKIDKIKDNIRYSLGEGIPVLDKAFIPHGRHAVIIGGGPSMNGLVEEISTRKDMAQDIIALNNSWKWLEKRNIKADCQIMLDARPENADFVPPSGNGMTRLYATQCDHRVINLVKKENTLLWNSYIPGIEDSFNDKNMFWVGFGTTVGIRAIFLLYTMGYRDFHLYGYDSSYENEEGHAYEQKLNHGEKVLDVVCYGRKFRAAPWMISQAENFLEAMEWIMSNGCTVTIHGDGLLPHMAKHGLVEKEVIGDMMKISGVYWPASDTHCHIAAMKTIDDLDRVISMVPKKGTAVQAGGNVGVWPKRLAESFEKVYTFEPDDLNFRCMELNCTEENIIKHKSALGYSSGYIGLERNDSNTGAHRVNGEGNIPITAIDSLGLDACDLIYLDVEGYELFALQGAKNTIEKFSPLIVAEYNSQAEKYGVKQGDIEGFLSTLGYELDGNLNRDLVFKKREKMNGTC